MPSATIGAVAVSTNKRWVVLGFICLAIWINAIDVTIVNVALGAIGEDLHATNADLQWVLDAFNVAVAGFVLLGSGIADRFGRKRIFAIGCLVFAASSIWAALSSQAQELIAARFLMGVGIALILPASLTIITLLFSGEQRKTAIGCWAAVGGIGLAFGPVIGGLLLETGSWGIVFWVNVPAALIAMVGVWLLAEESFRPNTQALDLVGGLLSVLALGGVVFGAIEGPTQGWTSPMVIAAWIIGIAALVIFIRWELQNPAAMLDLRVLKIKELAAGALIGGMIFFIVYVILYILPQSLQYGRELSTSAVGLAMLPLSLVYALGSPLSPKILRTFGLRRSMVGGMMLMALGLLSLAFTLNSSYWLLMISMFALGIGWASLVTPAVAVVMDSLPVAKAGDGSAINQISRQVGGALGIAIVGSIVTSIYSSQVRSNYHGQDLESIQNSLAAAAATAAELPAAQAETVMNAATDAFSQAATAGLFVTATLAILSAVVTLIALRPRTS